MNEAPTTQTPQRRPRRAGLAAALAAATIAGAAGSAAAVTVFDAHGSTAVREVTVQSATPAATSDTTIGAVYKTASKSIVEITVSSRSAGQLGGAGAAQSQGSGFVLDKAGHIVTNQHVVDGAASISVKFGNGSTYKATLVGADPSTDVAVIKIDAPASALSPLQLADSSAVQVGDGVIAIGSPFGLDLSVTSGIVSALHRQITSPNNFAIDDAIQTDAAINHGNSGGPLLNLEGRVIGVNSQIESDGGGSDGVGFAVPSNTVGSIAKQLIATGKVEHAYLGIATSNPASGKGAQVAQVRTSTPAAAAGLRAGDVITAIDDAAIASSDALRTAIDAHRPGDTVKLTVVRSGQTTSIPVTLGTRPGTA